MFEFSDENIAGVTVLHLTGKMLGDSNTQAMCAHLKTIIESGQKFLVMDFRNVQWMNSSSIGVIISCLTALRRHGGDVRFANLHDMSRQYFHITRLETVVKIFASVDQAVASFKSEPVPEVQADN